MEMVLAVVGVFVALLSVAALVVTARANKAHADNNQVLAEQLDTFEEALVLARDVGARVAGGEPLPSAIVSVGGTAAAHDLLRRFKTFAHLACFLVVVLLAGCNASPVTREKVEHLEKSIHDERKAVTVRAGFEVQVANLRAAEDADIAAIKSASRSEGK